VELKPAGVERNAALNSCDASEGEVDVESAHAATARSAAAAVVARNDKPFIQWFSDRRRPSDLIVGSVISHGIQRTP
jgi:hypothetical protein